MLLPRYITQNLPTYLPIRLLNNIYKFQLYRLTRIYGYLRVFLTRNLYIERPVGPVYQPAANLAKRLLNRPLRRYLERNFDGVLAREVAGIDWTRRPLMGDLQNIHGLLIGPPSNID